jgi:hypothetical protein
MILLPKIALLVLFKLDRLFLKQPMRTALPNKLAQTSGENSKRPDPPQIIIDLVIPRSSHLVQSVRWSMTAKRTAEKPLQISEIP